MNELLDAADWVYRNMRTDPDVKAVFTQAMRKRGFRNVAEFCAAKPDEFVALYKATLDMVEQVPDTEIHPGDLT